MRTGISSKVSISIRVDNRTKNPNLLLLEESILLVSFQMLFSFHTIEMRVSVSPHFDQREPWVVLPERKVVRKGPLFISQRPNTTTTTSIVISQKYDQMILPNLFCCSSVGSSTPRARCSAVWSAHLFWVQRAIGSNPVTLM